MRSRKSSLPGLHQSVAVADGCSLSRFPDRPSDRIDHRLVSVKTRGIDCDLLSVYVTRVVTPYAGGESKQVPEPDVPDPSVGTLQREDSAA